jgi:GAF domain-containing protein
LKPDNAVHADFSVPARLPQDEGARLAALQGYCVLDTLPDKTCDQITELARSLFGVEISLVSLVDEERQWFKSRAGLSAHETPRSMSFCAHAILSGGSRWCSMPSKTHAFAATRWSPVRRASAFYAGAPLVSSQGHALGTLCLIDPHPRQRLVRPRWPGWNSSPPWSWSAWSSCATAAIPTM